MWPLLPTEPHWQTAFCQITLVTLLCHNNACYESATKTALSSSTVLLTNNTQGVQTCQSSTNTGGTRLKRKAVPHQRRQRIYTASPYFYVISIIRRDTAGDDDVINQPQLSPPANTTERHLATTDDTNRSSLRLDYKCRGAHCTTHRRPLSASASATERWRDLFLLFFGVTSTSTVEELC